MGEVRENIRKNLGYYLTLRGMSQKELAEKLGVSQSSVTCWIKGKNAPDIEVVAQICDVLDISVVDLFGTDGSGELTKEFQEAMRLFKDLRPEFQNYVLQQIDKLLELQKTEEQ
ncbi:MAG: helix-turn-helix domain-containing protein [Streptococcaceae bacterium]|nr:helix-turn-helix domain-containing protein [Streptococcaceae bacterium]